MKISRMKRAALIWGRSEQLLRLFLQQDKLPFGSAVKGKGSHYIYHVEDHLLREYIGEEKWKEGLQRVEEYIKSVGD